MWLRSEAYETNIGGNVYIIHNVHRLITCLFNNSVSAADLWEDNHEMRVRKNMKKTTLVYLKNSSFHTPGGIE
jgi:hypothetical protein